MNQVTQVLIDRRAELAFALREFALADDAARPAASVNVRASLLAGGHVANPADVVEIAADHTGWIRIKLTTSSLMCHPDTGEVVLIG